MANIGLSAVLDLGAWDSNVKKYLSDINQMASVNKKFSSTGGGSGFGAALSNLSDSLFSLERVKDIVSGVFVIGVYRAISNAIRSVTADVMESVGGFQKLMIQLQGLAARDYVRRWGGSVQNAFSLVANQAQNTFAWIRKLSVTTPFSVESVSQALAYAQAFGFTITQAKRLIVATGDFTAGMGLGNEQFERILYNFGQMLASGRVLGREMRDLANNFVPIQDIIQAIATKTGKSFNDIREEMKKGQISATEFIEVFQEMAERDFPGAMERMSRTLPGVIQNIKDFLHTAIGFDFLGPIAGRISGQLADILEGLFDPKIMNAFKLSGLALLDTYNKIFEAISGIIERTANFKGAEITSGFAKATYNVKTGLIPAINDFFNEIGIGAPKITDLAKVILYIGEVFKALIGGASTGVRGFTTMIKQISDIFGDTFSGLITKMFTWGSNIIISFARGIVAAAVYVINAIAAIAAGIAGLLKAGSPPPILPRLTDWGKAAMESWLEGWTQADLLSGFKQIASTITALMRSMSMSEDNTNLIPSILRFRKALLQGMNELSKFGAMSESTMNKIVRSVSGATSEVRHLVEAFINLQTARVISEQVGNILSFDFEKGLPTKIFGRVVDNIKELRAAAQNLTGDLRSSVMAYIDNMERLGVSTTTISSLQDELNDKTAYYDELLDELNKQLEQVTTTYDDELKLQAISGALATNILTLQERKRIENMRDQILISRRIKATQQEKNEVTKYLNGRIAAEEKIREELQKTFDYQKALIDLTVSDQLAAAQAEYDYWQSVIDIQTENNELLKEQLALLKRISDAKKAGAEEPGGGLTVDTSAIEDAFDDLKKTLDEALKTLKKQVEDSVQKFFDDLSALFAPLTEPLMNLWNNILLIFKNAKDSPILKDFREIWENFVNKVGKAFENFNTFMEKYGTKISDAVTEFFRKLGIALEKKDPLTKESVMDKLGKFIDGIAQIILNISKYFKENGPEIVDNFKKLLDRLIIEIVPKLSDILDFLNEKVLPILQKVVDYVLEHGDELLPKAIKIGLGLLAIKEGFALLSGPMSGVTELLTTLALIAIAGPGILTTAGALVVLAGALGTLGLFIQTGSKKDLKGKSAFEVVGKAWGDIVDTVEKIVKDLDKAWTDLKAAWKKLVDFLNNPENENEVGEFSLGPVISRWFAGLWTSITESAKKFFEPVTNVFEDLRDSLKKFFSADFWMGGGQENLGVAGAGGANQKEAFSISGMLLKWVEDMAKDLNLPTIMAPLNKVVADVTKAIEEIIAGISTVFTKKFWTDLFSKTETAELGLILDLVNRIASTFDLEAEFAPLIKIKDDIIKAINDVIIAITSVFTLKFWQDLFVKTVTPELGLILDLINRIVSTFNLEEEFKPLITIRDAIVKKINEIIESIKKVFTKEYWQNLLKGITTPNIELPTVTPPTQTPTAPTPTGEPTITESPLTSMKTSIDTDANIIRGKISAFFASIPPLVSTGIQTVVTTITTFYQPLFDAAYSFWKGFQDALILKFTEIYTDLSTKLAELVESIRLFFQPLYDITIEFFQNFATALVDKFIEITSLLGETVIGLVDTLKSHYKYLYDKTVELFDKFKAGMVAKFFGEDGIYTKFKILIQDLAKVIQDVWANLKNMGIKIIEGIIEGLEARATALYNKIKNIVQEAINKALVAAGIRSPSTEFMYVGEQMMNGLIVGLENGMVEARTVINSGVKSMITSYKKLPSLDLNMNPNFRYGNGKFGSPTSNVMNNSKTINVEVNPTYKNYASEASVYHDVAAALAYTAM